MKIYILDVKSKGLEQMLLWLSLNPAVRAVEVYENYKQFIERSEKSPPDICIIRLGNNNIPGLKAAGILQNINPLIRIVFVSDDSDYAIDAYEMGAYGYLISPVNRAKLEKCLFHSNKIGYPKVEEKCFIETKNTG